MQHHNKFIAYHNWIFRPDNKYIYFTYNTPANEMVPMVTCCTEHHVLRTPAEGLHLSVQFLEYTEMMSIWKTFNSINDEYIRTQVQPTQCLAAPWKLDFKKLPNKYLKRMKNLQFTTRAIFISHRFHQYDTLEICVHSLKYRCTYSA